MKALVAISGGADSTCLLLMLQAQGADLRALHCNHRLRGAASDADERFVRRLCARLKVPLKVFRKKIKKGPGLEERARAWRRVCYAKAALHFRVKRVYLAHHAFDQAETLLLNLARGAGLKGAGGMRVESRLGALTLVRPLLEKEPAELRAWLKSRGEAWREDKSNAKAVSRRNVLRAKVLPALESLMPGAASRMAAFSRRAREADEALEGLAAGALKKARRGRAWALEDFRKAPAWLRRRMLMGLDPGGVMDEAALLRAEALVKKGQGKADLRRKQGLEASRGRLFLRIE